MKPFVFAKYRVLEAALFAVAFISGACVQRVEIEFSNESTFTWAWSLQSKSAAVACEDKARTLSLNPSALEVEATFNDCPVIDTFVIAPSQTSLGQVIALRSGARDDAQPSALTYAWREGKLTFARTADANYRCRQVGKHTLTLITSDGACETTQSVDIHCTAAQGRN